MRKYSEHSRQRCLPGWVLAGLLLISPLAPGQEQAPPAPPEFTPVETERRTFYQPASDAFIAAPLPVAEWTLHKSADGSYPDASEQKMLWLMNRARQDPAAEGVWLASITDPNVTNAINVFGVDLVLMQADFAVYQRAAGAFLYCEADWKAPDDVRAVRKKRGTVRHEIIKKNIKRATLIHDLGQTAFAETD